MLETVAVTAVNTAAAPSSPFLPFKLSKTKLKPRAISVPVELTVTVGVSPSLVPIAAVAPVIVAALPGTPCGPGVSSTSSIAFSRYVKSIFTDLPFTVKAELLTLTSSMILA